MRTFSATDLSKHIGDVIKAARRGPVFITKQRRPKLVLMTLEEYDRLCSQADRREAFTLDTMSKDLEDGLLALADSYGEVENAH